MTRTHIVAGLIALAGSLSCLGQSRTAPAGSPILVYHRFDSQQVGPTTVRTETFRAQLSWLDKHQYRIVPLQTLLGGLSASQVPDGRSVALTIDDGHRSVYTELFPLILQYRIPVTLFIYPSAISNASYALTWDELREMRRSGLVCVQSHTYSHPNFHREKAHLTPAAYQSLVATQLSRSRHVLEQQLGGRVDLLAWPFGIVDPELEDAARRAGYQAGFAYAGGRLRAGTDRLALPRIPVADRDQGKVFGELLTSGSGGPKP